MSNIDLGNKNEFITMLALIIYDKYHPLRGDVIADYEDIADVILELHINKKTYREIIISKYGDISLSDLKQKEDKLKQKVKLGLSIFKERLKQIYS